MKKLQLVCQYSGGPPMWERVLAMAFATVALATHMHSRQRLLFFRQFQRVCLKTAGTIII